MLKNTLWFEKYAPQSLDECFLPAKTRKELAKYMKKRDLPNMLFSGQPGIGKTATAIAMMKQLDAEYILINASLDNGIETLRNDITQFASTISLNGEKKYVILDEADYLSQNAQAAFRGFLSQYSANCGFIFTCNFSNKLIGPLAESRLSEVNFVFEQDEKVDLAKHLYQLAIKILTAEGVTHEVTSVREFILVHLKRSNDLRRFLVLLQKFSATGTFEHDVKQQLYSEKFIEMVAILKTKNFNNIRTWVGENSDIDPSLIYRYLYDYGKDAVKAGMAPALTTIINDHQFKHAFVADAEINVASCLTIVMADCM